MPFQFNLNNFSTKMGNKAKKVLKVWRNFLTRSTKFIPICLEKIDQPLATHTFALDAAVFADNSIWANNIGCRVIGPDADHNTAQGDQMWWPEEFITKWTNNKGERFGNKTTTFQMIGHSSPAQKQTYYVDSSWITWPASTAWTMVMWRACNLTWISPYLTGPVD